MWQGHKDWKGCMNIDNLDEASKYFGEIPDIFGTWFGRYFIVNEHPQHSKSSGISPKWQGHKDWKGRMSIIYIFRGKYPVFLAHSFGDILLSMNILNTQKFRVFLRNIYVGRHTTIANVSIV